jgi:hypothetical protein
MQIYAQGFGQGSAGLCGTGLQLVVIVFVELFGVSLGQVVAAMTPSVQMGILFDPFIMVVLTTFCSYFFDLCNFVYAGALLLIRRCNHPVPESGSRLEGVGVSTRPIHATIECHVIH